MEMALSVALYLTYFQSLAAASSVATTSDVMMTYMCKTNIFIERSYVTNEHLFQIHIQLSHQSMKR
jgi:hypothetical protein